MTPGHVLWSSLFGYTGHTKSLSLHSFFFLKFLCAHWPKLAEPHDDALYFVVIKRLHDLMMKLNFNFILIDSDLLLSI